MELRPYQSEAIDAARDYIAGGGQNGLICIPTGGGKTVVFAEIIRRLMSVTSTDRSVSILTAQKELTEQAAGKLRRIWPDAPIGIACAGIGKPDYSKPITIGTVQTMHGHVFDMRPQDLIIADEAHLIPPTGEGRWRSIIRDFRIVRPSAVLLGFTATPFRLDGGPIAGPGRIFDATIYSASMAEMIADGYLCPITTKATRGGRISMTGARRVGGDYSRHSLELATSNTDIAAEACDEIIERCADRNAILIFCASIDHANMVSGMMQDRGVPCPVVTGKTPAVERVQILDDFDRGRVRAVANVNCLTTGLDITRIDAIALLRPTLSASLYVQMVGRGLRPDPSKTDCLVLDFAGNAERHGPIDLIEPRVPGKGNGDGAPPMKECEACMEMILAQLRVCPSCGHEFQFDETPPHEGKPSEGVPIISTDTVPEREYPIMRLLFAEHQKAGKPDSIRMSFATLGEEFPQWLCFDHGGLAAVKARDLWRRCFGTAGGAPRTVAQAWEIIREIDWLPDAVTHIAVKRIGQWDRIVRINSRVPDGEHFDPCTPDDDGSQQPKDWYESADLEDIPF